MTTDILELYQSIFEHQGIQFLTFDDDFHNIGNIDYNLRKLLFKNYTYNDFISILHRLTDQNPVIYFHDKFGLDYCTLLFPQAWQEEYQIKYIVIGPILTYLSDTHKVRAVMKDYGIPMKYFQDCLEFYNRIPTIPSKSIWFSLLRPFLVKIYSSDIEYQFLEFAPEVTDVSPLLTTADNVASLSALENRYYIENQILDAVSKGNNELAIDWFRKFTNFKLSPRSANPIRHQKNMLLVFNTLLRKTVERTNIHPYYIDRLSSEFAVKIELCSSIHQLESMDAILIRKYCLLVKNHSVHHYSEIIEKCIQYIDLNYMYSFTVNTLANYCSVTGNYLSAAFRKETGKTLTEYINETRIEHSILLLNTTKSPIQQIANQCGFSDANYYSRIFKKYKGITPLSYRKNIQA